MPTDYKYRAFISYSHKDEKWASWLHRALETYKVPKYLVGEETPLGTVPDRLGKVFRDREELSSAHSLGNELTQALEDSACQIVICSPNAAKSHWTNEEIKAYKRLGRENRIFCLIVGGEPYASGNPDTEDDECFPAALRFRAGPDGELTDEPSEPIAADARPQGDGKQNAKLKLISGLLGVGFDALKQREQQRRHRRMLAITAAASIGMVFTSALAGYALIQRNEAESQRARAEAEAEIARETRDFMVGLFEVSDPSEALGNTITAREILDKGAERISSELADQPEIQATLMDTMGQVYTSLGLYGRAGDLLDEALATRQSASVGSPAELADTMDNLARLLALAADYDRARALFERSLALRQGIEYEDPREGALQRAGTLTGLAETLDNIGEHGAAEPLIIESLDSRRALLEPPHADIAENLEDLGLNHYYQGEYADAIQALRSAVEMRRALHDGPYPATAEAISNLALVHLEIGDYNVAETLYSEALEMDRLLLGERHPELSSAINNLAYVYHDKGDLDAAETLYLQVISIDREMLGDTHPQLARAVSNLAILMLDKGELDAAIELQTNAVEILDKAYEEAHPELAEALSGLGFMLNEAGNPSAAEPHLVRALAMREIILGIDSPEVGRSLITMATLYLDTDRPELAETEAGRAYDIFTASVGADHWLAGAALSIRGGAQAAQQRFDEAEDTLLRAYETLENSGSAAPVFVDATRQRLASLYEQTGRPGEMAPYQLESNE